MCKTKTDRENREQILQAVKQCSKEGNRLDAGLVVFRGDKRNMDEIKAAGGFVPSTILDIGENMLQHAKKQAEAILKEKPGELINAWKYSVSAPPRISSLVVGEKGRLAGVSCGILGGQKGGNEYKISVPEPLYVVGRKEENGSAVAIYGNDPDLDKCTILAMHFILMQNAEEFVFLTEVPMEWIEEWR